MLVNVTGKSNKYVPADLRCEFLVKAVKEHIKHLQANKTEQNILKWTGVMAMLEQVCHQYDMVASVAARNGRHAIACARKDEEILHTSLRPVRAFHYVPGRAMKDKPNMKMPMSILTSLDYVVHHKWIHNRMMMHTDEI